MASKSLIGLGMKALMSGKCGSCRTRRKSSLLKKHTMDSELAHLESAKYVMKTRMNDGTDIKTRLLREGVDKNGGYGTGYESSMAEAHETIEEVSVAQSQTNSLHN